MYDSQSLLSPLRGVKAFRRFNTAQPSRQPVPGCSIHRVGLSLLKKT